MGESMKDRVAKAILDRIDLMDGLDAVAAASYAEAAIEAMRELPHETKKAIWELLEGNARVGNLKPGHIAGNGMPDAIMQIVVRSALSPSREDEGK